MSVFDDFKKPLKQELLPLDKDFGMAPGLWERLALAAGRFFIATGEKLVRLAAPEEENRFVFHH